MNKYIIKNCPCIETTEYYLRGELITECICTSNREEFRLCQNRTCLLKRIVEKCRFWLKYSVDKHCAKEILDMLEIEELQDET